MSYLQIYRYVLYPFWSMMSCGMYCKKWFTINLLNASKKAAQKKGHVKHSLRLWRCGKAIIMLTLLLIETRCWVSKLSKDYIDKGLKKSTIDNYLQIVSMICVLKYNVVLTQVQNSMFMILLQYSIKCENKVFS